MNEKVVIHHSFYDGWRTQIKVFRALLMEWAHSEYGAFIGHTDEWDGDGPSEFVCELCFARSRDLDHLKHTETCLLARTRRALTADDDTLRALLETMKERTDS